MPTTWGMELANWNWKVVGQFVWERYGISISRSGCLKWLHRLGFAYKRPKKRLLKADDMEANRLRGRVRHFVGGVPGDGSPDILR